MHHLIIHGDPGIRRGARIEVADREVVCFGINRNGEYHGPADVQLWCVVGDPGEFEAYERRDFVPMFLDVERVDAADVTVLRERADLAIDAQ